MGERQPAIYSSSEELQLTEKAVTQTLINKKREIKQRMENGCENNPPVVKKVRLMHGEIYREWEMLARAIPEKQQSIPMPYLDKAKLIRSLTTTLTNHVTKSKGTTNYK